MSAQPPQTKQTLSNKIGNAIGEARRRLLDRIKAGASFEAASSLFISEITLAFETISRSEAENVRPQSV